LKVGGGMRLNSFYHIPFYYYFSNLNNKTLLYFIPLRSLYFINPNGTLVSISTNIKKIFAKQKNKKKPRPHNSSNKLSTIY
jgi:hypothetical protein